MKAYIVQYFGRLLSCLLLVGMVAPTARSATVEYIHTDALGSPVAVTNSAGQVIERREYEPYGRQLVPTAVADGPGFTGHVSDAATGLDYMQQRYYDPTIGRFLSVDPVTANSGTGANFNRYWYANNNPYKFIDPDGRLGCAASRIASVCESHGMVSTSVRSPLDTGRNQQSSSGGSAAGGSSSSKPQQSNDEPKKKDGIMTPQKIYDRASREASRSGLPGAHNGPQDALRHCIGTCDMTRRNGWLDTLVFGELNEKRGDWTHNQSAEEKAMDRHNNAVGDALGRRASTFRDCAVGCRAVVDRGITINGISSETPYVQYENDGP